MRRSVFSLVLVLGLLLAFGLTTACKQPDPEPVVEEIVEPAPVEEEAPDAEGEGEEEAAEEEAPPAE